VSDRSTGDAGHQDDLSQSAADSRDIGGSPDLVPDQDAHASHGSRRSAVSRMTIMAPDRAAEPQSDRTEAHAKSHQSKAHQKSRSQDWDDLRIDPAMASVHDGRASTTRKTSAIIAVAVVAGIAGAVGTAMAMAGITYFSSKPDPAVAANQARALDESMTRIENDLAALRSNVDRTAKTVASQANKTADRLDRIEKAQAEPAAKLAKLTETVEKLRVAAATPPAPAPAPTPPPAPVAATPPPPAPAPVAALPSREITGSVTPKEAPPPKAEIARLPTIDGWVVLDARNGSATVEGRPGIFDVFAGDPLPGLGRVDAIRRQDGRWVVVTSKGLIVQR
jgi:hypothetical protein